MTTKTLRKKKQKKELAKWKLSLTIPKESSAEPIKMALHELLMRLLGTSNPTGDVKQKQKEKSTQKEPSNKVENKADGAKQAYARQTSDSPSNQKYEPNPSQPEKKPSETYAREKYQNTPSQTEPYAKGHERENTPYKSEGDKIRESPDVVSQWETYARAQNSERTYDRLREEQPRHTENHPTTQAQSQRSAYEERQTLDTVASSTSIHYKQNAAQESKAGTESVPPSSLESLQQKVEQNTIKPELSMEQQMLQLERYESNAATALKSYQSGKADAQTASLIDSVKSQIDYKGPCCDQKLVNALVEYQENKGLEIGREK